MKLIALYGPKRGGVRVKDAPEKDAILVMWRGANRQQESFPRTANGRAEAKAFAEGLVGGWLRRSASPVTLTVRGLWQQYLTAEAHNKRPASLIVYAGRWRKFEVFAGHDRDAAAVTLEEMDRYAKMLAERHAPNQVALHLQMVRLVFRWGRGRGLVTTSVPEHRYRLGIDQRSREPAEYTREEYDRILAQLDPESSRQWRAWAVLMLVGHQGPRINAALHLRWEDVVEGGICWPSATDKTGRTRMQPLTQGGQRALEVALTWRECDGYTGPWVFYRAQRRHDAPGPYTVQSAHRQLIEAEKRAGVAHLPGRGFHGGRKMVAGDVADATGDPWLALQMIGDRDPRRAREYVKERGERMQRAVDAIDARSAGEE